MSQAELGKNIPCFALESAAGKFTDQDLPGHRSVIYFYPRDHTPGRVLKGREFRDLYPKSQWAGIAVYGVSRDSLGSHERFRDQRGLAFPCITDPGEVLRAIFGIMREKTLYGRKICSIECSSFLLDSQGVLRREWRKVKPAGHAAEILKTAKTIA